MKAAEEPSRPGRGHLARGEEQTTRARGRQHVRPLAFASVGLSAFIVDMTCFLTISAAGCEHRIARTLAVAVAMTWTWALNREFTFADRPHTRRLPQWLRSTSASTLSASVNIGAYVVTTTMCPWLDEHWLVALAIGVGLGALLNYALAQTWVYPPARAKAGRPRTGGTTTARKQNGEEQTRHRPPTKDDQHD